MSRSRLSLSLFFLLLTGLYGVKAQKDVLRLESGTYPVPADLEERLSSDELPGTSFGNTYHALLSFDRIPDAKARKEMKTTGIRFLRYVPEKSYIVGYDRGTDLSSLSDHHTRSIRSLPREVRTAAELLERPYPSHAVNGDAIELELSFFSDLSFEDALSALQEELDALENAEILGRKASSARVEIRVPQGELSAFSELPYVKYVEPIDPEPTPDDRTGRSLHRSNLINGQIPGGLRYNGDSIVMAIADDGGIGPHIDFRGRVTDHTGGPGGGHGDMTAGIAVGAGNLDPTVQGMASGAYLHMYDISGYPHITNAITNLNNLGTRITSTSYSQGCNNYDNDAERADEQIYKNRELIHVFSAGNSASSDCGYGASGWGNITGGTKQGKNVIASGNLDDEDNLANSSSRGPAEDGRIKPDLCANGAGQLSTSEDNIYQTGGGTSAAAPGIAGVIAQLYDAYKDLYSGSFPSSALIKASLLNTAKDLDDHGPDFNTGWGRINAGKAYELLEDGRFLKDSVDQGGSNTHSISVPSGVDEVRVMVYWTDPAGSPSAAFSLVNDLNIQLTSPSGTSYDPWVLDHSPNSSSLDAPATRGRDSINNVEQVTLADPSAGTYDLSVNGYQVPQGAQSYFLVYEFLGVEGVELTYPNGSEGLVPGTTAKLRWDAFGDSADFDLEYSADSGNSWTSIASGVDSGRRFYDWQVPDTVSGNVFVRISRGSESDTNRYPFAMIDTASNIGFEWICPDSARITWDSVQGAAAYNVYKLGAKYMDSIGTSSDTSYVIRPFNPGKDQWFSVSPITSDSMEGRRTYAFHYEGGPTKNCPLDTNPGLKMRSPLNARIPSCNADSLPVIVEVRNDGLDSILSFDVSYTVDNGTPYTMNYNDTLAPDSSVTLTFPDSVELTTIDKEVRSWVDHPNDESSFNDSSQLARVRKVFSDLDTLHYSEDLEGESVCEGDHNDCYHTCNLQGDLSNQPHPEVDDIDWRVGKGNTPSPNTGPEFDFDPGLGTGKYLYLEPSYGCEGQVGNLLTPCLDISGKDPLLTFAYHMYGSEMGELHVDVLVDGVWHMDVMSPLKGDQGNYWQTDTVDLSAYSGDRLTVRFRGVTGDGFHSDIALDAIEVLDRDMAPEVEFSGKPRNLCTGQVVDLSDETVGLVDSLYWRIRPGTYDYVNGTDSSSKDPDLVFHSEGNYDVSLLASNKGAADSVLKSDFIVVGANSNAPLQEDFENNSFPPRFWYVEASGGTETWRKARNVVGANGTLTRTATLQNRYYDNNGVEDDLVTEVMDISGVEDPVMTFDVAYARRDPGNYDALIVRVAGDCGPVYNSEYHKIGSDLATVSDNSNAWAPTSSGDWRTDTVDLDPYKGSEELHIRFVNVNGHGNNLYIDNINVGEDPTSLEEKKANAVAEFKVYPNPVSDRLRIRGDMLRSSDLAFSIEDMRGRTVKEDREAFGQGRFRTELDVSSLEEGVYFLRVRSDDGEPKVKKFVVER